MTELRQRIGGTQQQGEYQQVPTGPEEYEDKYVRFGPEGIVLKRYYFPFCNSKRIPYTRVKSYRTAAQLQLPWYEYKDWGMGLSDIYWSIGRHSQVLENDESRILVFEVEGNFFRCGTSVVDAERALAVLAAHCPHAGINAAWH